ncbi:MAG: hypothetical protein ACK4TA_11310, partial [Saprospiraceae bacterium]
MKKSWWMVALINLLLAVSIGAVLRFAFVSEIPGLPYKNFLHAHSHVAMLGWIYLALYNLLIHQFLPKEKQKAPAYNWLFWITQISVVGMLISFPLQGYGPISIAFSVMHILCSYVFVGWFWADLEQPRSASRTLLLTALIFMLISTLGVWAMGPIMATKLKGSAFYYMAVQFYLHFQFNGWFIFGVLSLFFKQLEKNGIVIPVQQFRRFYYILLLSCPLTYALAVAWANPILPVFVANSIGVLLQLIAALIFVQIIRNQKYTILNIWHSWERTLIIVAFYSFLFKMVVQALVALPFIAEAAYTIRNYVIGFIHLVLLGAISTYLISYAVESGLISSKSRMVKAGIGCFIAGFLLSEALLFLQGTMLWGAKGFLPFYYEMLFGTSVLIPLGIALLLINGLKKIAFQQLYF